MLTDLKAQCSSGDVNISDYSKLCFDPKMCVTGAYVLCLKHLAIYKIYSSKILESAEEKHTLMGKVHANPPD